MKNYYDLSFRTLSEILTPTLLRKPALLAVIQVLILPSTWIHNYLLRYRYDTLYRLSITGQVFSMEKMLNDRYDNTLRRIYIINGVFYEQLYIYTNDEDADEYIYTRGEEADVYIYNENEAGGADFIVNVPAAIFSSSVMTGLSIEKEMMTLINIYKQPGYNGIINRL